MMGSGKSTLGKRLAEELDSGFIDLDREIERRNGVTVSTIFEIEGEAGFRRRESALLEEVCNKKELSASDVCATGGGVVLDPLNRARLQAHGLVVYLAASPELLFLRTKTDKNRPLLQVEKPMKLIRQLVVRREPLYREIADLIVEAGRDITQSIDLIEKRLVSL